MNIDESNLYLLSGYMNTRRGVGHTTAMIQGAIHTNPVNIMVNYAPEIKFIKPFCNHANFIVWHEEIDRLRSSNSPLVFDNFAIVGILNSCYKLLHQKQDEINLLQAQVHDLESLLKNKENK